MDDEDERDDMVRTLPLARKEVEIPEMPEEDRSLDNVKESVLTGIVSDSEEEERSDIDETEEGVIGEQASIQAERRGRA